MDYFLYFFLFILMVKVIRFLYMDVSLIIVPYLSFPLVKHKWFPSTECFSRQVCVWCQCQPLKSMRPTMKDKSAMRWQRWHVRSLLLKKDCPLMERARCLILFSWQTWQMFKFLEWVCGCPPLKPVFFLASLKRKQSIPCEARLVLVSGCLRPLFCCGWQHMTKGPNGREGS